MAESGARRSKSVAVFAIVVLALLAMIDGGYLLSRASGTALHSFAAAVSTSAHPINGKPAVE